MKDAFLVMTLSMGLLAVAATHAHAQQDRCATREGVVSRLSEKYGETRQSIGLGTNNTMVEVFASGDTGSWTILVTDARGISCLVASGQAFETLAEAAPIPEKDA
ncbi:hypothetical protein [Primorskyibacter sedentarius]|uniref:Uncharacterized protein n=1 Tax=Primorskyibacter sedentarius TaxID=745311 RepID=A0A4R3J6E7_9RHOB|nr:hypothetical protein [Primorskyibacter sedentarius]TCS60020.1 hypothetical protein EDD52_11630 [Primorskyibacter sedentarius]